MALILCAAARAAAQQPAPSQGPLVLESMHNGFVAGPDVKFTSAHGDTATLVGGYGAWIHDDRLLLGGAAYFRADGNHHSQELGYGGFQAGWIFMPGDRFSITAKGLMGFGHETTGVAAVPIYGPVPMPFGHDNAYARYYYHHDFFVAEPELDVRFGVTRWLSVQAGASYRLADEPRGLDSFAAGAAGSVAAQFKIGR